MNDSENPDDDASDPGDGLPKASSPLSRYRSQNRDGRLGVSQEEPASGGTGSTARAPRIAAAFVALAALFSVSVVVVVVAFVVGGSRPDDPAQPLPPVISPANTPAPVSGAAAAVPPERGIGYVRLGGRQHDLRAAFIRLQEPMPRQAMFNINSYSSPPKLLEIALFTEALDESDREELRRAPLLLGDNRGRPKKSPAFLV